MDAPKSRPAVTITTYSANNSSYFSKHSSSNLKQQQQKEEDDEREHATKCEFSTNLFRNNIRKQLKHGLIISERQRSHQTLLNAAAASAASTANATRVAAGQSRRGVLTDLSQIRGPTGSVRGHKDVVRKSLEGIKVTYHNRFMNQHDFSSSSSAAAALSSLASSSGGGGGGGGSSLLSFSGFLPTRDSVQSLRPQSNQPSLTSFSANNKPRALSMTSSSLLTIDNELYCSEYLERLVEDEQNLCVAYTTTLGVIRRTFEDSKMLKSILDLNLVKYEERDIYLNQEYKCQLKMRSGSIVVPALYVDGLHVGGAKELETMNESGELKKLLAKFKMSRACKEICYCCGNAKFIACQSCNGSRKSTIHHFKFNSVALRCIKCDKNDGLVQCPVCFVHSTQQSPSYSNESDLEKQHPKPTSTTDTSIDIVMPAQNKEEKVSKLLLDGDKTINDGNLLSSMTEDLNNNLRC